MKQNNTHETLLARWIEGDLTPKEAEQLAEMEGLQDLRDALDVYDDMELPAYDLNKAWDRLAAKTIYAEKTIKTKHKSLFPTMMRIAAAIALIVGIGLGYSTYFRPKQFFTSAGQTAQVTLPDGSAVTLNAGSGLDYTLWQWKRNKVVHLTGEAFFKVTKGQKFTVKTPQGQTAVLGTQFDVLDRGKTFQVKCFEGKVWVTNQVTEKIITKGQGVKFSGQVAKDLDVTSHKPGWMAGESKFFENSLQEVFDEMQRQFTLEIQSDGVDMSRRFTGVFSNQNLEKALATVCGAMHLTYEIKNDQKLVKISSAK